MGFAGSLHDHRRVREVTLPEQDRINVRDAFLIFGGGMGFYIFRKIGSFFLPRVMWTKKNGNLIGDPWWTGVVS